VAAGLKRKNGEAMDLKEKLFADYKKAMKEGDKLKVSTIRLILSEVKNAEIAKREELDEEEMLSVVSREARKRKESIEEFDKGGRQDLVEKEEHELEIIESYMPEQLSEGEVLRIIEETIADVGASSASDLGKVMGRLMPRLKGKADGKKVNQIVREMLQG
jgi:uncharacterized protein